MAQGLKRDTVNATVVGSIPIRGKKYFHFFAMLSSQSATLSFSTQHVMSRIQRKMENERVLMEGKHLDTNFSGSICLLRQSKKKTRAMHPFI